MTTMTTRRRWPAGVAALALVIAGGAACRSRSGPALPTGELALVPGDASLVLRADLSQLRASPPWARLTALAGTDPTRQQGLTELARRTGLDPVKQIKSVVWAASIGGGAGDFALLIRGGPFDEPRLAAYAGDQLQRQGGRLVTADVGRHHVYTDGNGRIFVAVLDGKTVVVGSKAWTAAAIGLAEGTTRASIVTAPAWTALLAKLRTGPAADRGGAIWAAAVVTEPMRAQLEADPRLRLASSVEDGRASADLRQGLSLNATLGLQSEGDAAAVAVEAAALLEEARSSQALMVLGLVPYLDGVSAQARGKDVAIRVALSPARLDDLVIRLDGLLTARPAAAAL